MRRRRLVPMALLWIAACGFGLAQDGNSIVVQAPNSKPLVPTGTISGTVYSADTNLPARLALIAVMPAAKGGRSFTRQSDLEGRFTIGKVPEGKYYVSAQVTGYLNPLATWMESGTKGMSAEQRKALEARVTTVFVTAKQTATAPLRLERGAEISGTVLYDDGSPAIGLQVSLRPKAESSAGPAEAPEADLNSYIFDYMAASQRVTDDRGRFRILGVAPGEYLVCVMLSTASGEHEGQNGFVRAVQSSPVGGLTVYLGDTLRASKAKTLKIEGGEARGDGDITIPLGKLHTIRGQVVVKSSGLAPPTAMVQLLYADTHEMARMAVAVDGEFEFNFVGEDSFVLRAEGSTDPLPKDIDPDEEDGEGSFLFSGTRMGPDSIQAGSDVAVMVAGNVSGVTIAVPDPTPKKANAAPVPTDATAPVSPQ